MHILDPSRPQQTPQLAPLRPARPAGRTLRVKLASGSSAQWQ
jgi:hypothetical protein